MCGWITFKENWTGKCFWFIFYIYTYAFRVIIHAIDCLSLKFKMHRNGDLHVIDQLTVYKMHRNVHSVDCFQMAVGIFLDNVDVWQVNVLKD